MRYAGVTGEEHALYKIATSELETVCGVTSRLPENRNFEVAFAGKSNVGKSSLINVLLARKSLARTSSQPGKTQTINYYRVNKGRRGEDFAPDCYLVDLPGYGYAAKSKDDKVKWGAMIENYLHTSKQLRAVFLLVDIRHDPSENDKLMHDWIIANGMQPVIIATKKDKIKRTELNKKLNAIRTILHVPSDSPVVAFSAQTKEGREEIWDVISRCEEGEN